MFKSLIGKEISEEDANYASGLTAVCSIINGGKQFNSVPDEASLEFNVRPVPEYDNDFIESFSKISLMMWIAISFHSIFQAITDL